MVGFHKYNPRFVQHVKADVSLVVQECMFSIEHHATWRYQVHLTVTNLNFGLQGNIG